MERIKFKTNFYLEKRKGKNGQFIESNMPILMTFSFEGKRLQYYTGYRIDLKAWDTAKQEVKRNNVNTDGISSVEINSELTKLKSLTESIYRKSYANDETLSVEDLRNELKNQLKKKPSKTGFFEYYDQFMETEGKANDWTAGTYTKFRVIRKQLLRFQEVTRQKVEFDRMNESFFMKWLDFQRDKLGHRNTTLSKNLRILKWFLKWTVRKRFNKNPYFEDFKPKFKGITRSSKIVYLDWQELMSLYNMEISKNYLEQVRDVFCFCCFTGLRYSDVKNLKRSDIKENTIEFITVKTDEYLPIDLNDYSRAILEKYKDIPFKNDKCLPVISNQKMNEYLKELGKVAGIDEPVTVVYFKGAERIEETFKKYELLSTHVGRKTFVTNAFFFNIPAEVIMAWTGHKDHKTMENYYKIVAGQKQREMKKFNQE